MSCYFACNGFETIPTFTPPPPQLSTQKFQPIASKPSLTFRGRKIFMSQWWIYREGGGGGVLTPVGNGQQGCIEGCKLQIIKLKSIPLLMEKA